MSTNEAQNDIEQEVPLLELEQAQMPVEADNDSAAPLAQVVDDSEAEVPELEVLEAEPANSAEAEQVEEPELENARAETVVEPAESPESANDSDPAMDTVRELLFGDSLKAVRRELHLTVRNLRGSVKVMHHELSKRNEELAEQISAVQLALDNESEEREALSDIVTEQINQSSEQLKVKLTEQQDAVDVAMKQVKADVEMAGNNQAHALEQLESKVFAALEEYSAEFREGKMNRSDFADMLSSLAGKVSAEE